MYFFEFQNGPQQNLKCYMHPIWVLVLQDACRHLGSGDQGEDQMGKVQYVSGHIYSYRKVLCIG